MHQNMPRHLEILRSVLPWPKVAVLSGDRIFVYADAEAIDAKAPPLGSVSEEEIRVLRIKGKGWTNALLQSLGEDPSVPAPKPISSEPVAPAGPLVTVVHVETPKKKGKKKGAVNGSEEAGSGSSGS